jgi:Mg2+/Co2+ transporter CorB
MGISKLRLRHLSETKPKRTKVVEKILKKPERLIGTILLSNNLVKVAMSALAAALAMSIWGQMGIVYITAVLTVTILSFAEITPKVYAKYFDCYRGCTEIPGFFCQIHSITTTLKC